MLNRLTRATRVRVASVLALLYTLCVLAPTAAFAFGDGAAHCLTQDNHGIQSAHVHAHEDGKSHIHQDATSDEHSQAPNSQDNTSNSQCCGLACLSALPASVLQIEIPALPAAIAASANEEDVTGKAPERLYRPPISPLSL